MRFTTLPTGSTSCWRRLQPKPKFQPLKIIGAMIICFCLAGVFVYAVGFGVPFVFGLADAAGAIALLFYLACKWAKIRMW